MQPAASVSGLQRLGSKNGDPGHFATENIWPPGPVTGRGLRPSLSYTSPRGYTVEGAGVGKLYLLLEILAVMLPYKHKVHQKIF